MDKLNIGYNIVLARHNKGFSQKSLSKKSTISRSTLSKIELGNQDPTIKTLEKISKSLDIKLEDLVNPNITDFYNSRWEENDYLQIILDNVHNSWSDRRYRMSQYDFVPISPSTLSRISKNMQSPKFSTLVRLAENTKQSPSDLLRRRNLH